MTGFLCEFSYTFCHRLPLFEYFPLYTANQEDFGISLPYQPPFLQNLLEAVLLDYIGMNVHIPPLSSHVTVRPNILSLYRSIFPHLQNSEELFILLSALTPKQS